MNKTTWPSHLLISFCCLFLFCYGISKPQYNWDIIGYVGAVFYSEGYRDVNLTEKTYGAIKQEIPDGKYLELVSGDYRASVATSESSLEEHMPFYRIRMIYVSTMKLLNKLTGLNITSTTFFIAAFFNSLSFLIYWILLPQKNLKSAFFLIGAAYISGQLPLSSLSTPDSMAAFACLLAAFCFQQKTFWLVPILIIVPLIRTDAVLASWIIAALVALEKKYTQAAMITLGSSLCYFTANAINDNYGYLKIFNFTLIQINPHPATMPLSSNLSLYMAAYLNGFKQYVSHIHFLIFIIYAIVIYRRSAKYKKILQEPIFILVNTYTLAHLMLFPAYYERFFVWVTILAMLDMWRKINTAKISESAR